MRDRRSRLSDLNDALSRAWSVEPGGCSLWHWILRFALLHFLRSKHGGLQDMGDALRSGMVVTMGVWEIGSPNWLDSSSEGAGPRDRKEGKPNQIKKDHPDASVTISDMRWGEIGATCR